MTQLELLRFLVRKILAIQKDSPVLVGIDGVDASGKTTLSNALTNFLTNINRSVIRTSIDGFHNPEIIRYKKGKDSPEGYYFDSFNIKALKENLLVPLLSGKLTYKQAVFDFRTNSKVNVSKIQAKKESILIMEGVFLFRPELVKYWDLKIFLDVSFEENVQRAVSRNIEKEHLGSEAIIRSKYEKRYIPGQKLYFTNAHPKETADIVINNNDYNNPIVVSERKISFRMMQKL